jgi:hypothetical protein
VSCFLGIAEERLCGNVLRKLLKRRMQDADAGCRSARVDFNREVTENALTFPIVPSFAKTSTPSSFHPRSHHILEKPLSQPFESLKLLPPLFSTVIGVRRLKTLSPPLRTVRGLAEQYPSSSVSCSTPFAATPAVCPSLCGYDPPAPAAASALLPCHLLTSAHAEQPVVHGSPTPPRTSPLADFLPPAYSSSTSIRPSLSSWDKNLLTDCDIRCSEKASPSQPSLEATSSLKMSESCFSPSSDFQIHCHIYARRTRLDHVFLLFVICSTFNPLLIRHRLLKNTQRRALLEYNPL